MEPFDTDDYEELDAVPVLSGPGEAPPPVPDLQPAAQGRGLLERVSGEVVVQAAAVATAGFAVGAATVVVAKRRRAKTPLRRRATKGGLDIAATKRFVIDVHTLRD